MHDITGRTNEQRGGRNREGDERERGREGEREREGGRRGDLVIFRAAAAAASLSFLSGGDDIAVVCCIACVWRSFVRSLLLPENRGNLLAEIKADMAADARERWQRSQSGSMTPTSLSPRSKKNSPEVYKLDKGGLCRNTQDTKSCPLGTRPNRSRIYFTAGRRDDATRRPLEHFCGCRRSQRRSMRWSSLAK